MLLLSGGQPSVPRSAPAPILVVDDDPNIVAMLGDVLENAGHRVITAGDGVEALERLRNGRPSLILLDMRMPRMDGWEFARAARQLGNTPPIVVITAAGDARAWAAEISADAYVSKPFTISELLGVVDRFGPRPF